MLIQHDQKYNFSTFLITFRFFIRIYCFFLDSFHEHMLLPKLPKILQSDPFVQTLATLIEGKKTLFSSIVYLNQGRTYIIKKNSETPYFDKDWQCYSFLRSYANTLITTGSVLREEKDLYKSIFACGDKLIEEMYQNFRNGQKQNVYVMSNAMKREEIATHFNHNIYNVLGSQLITSDASVSIGLQHILQKLLNQHLDPILVQCGPFVMNPYFHAVKQGKHKNLIDAVYLAYYQGHLEKNCIGSQVLFEQSIFNSFWKSEKFAVEHNGKQIGTVYFEAYLPKTTTSG